MPKAKSFLPPNYATPVGSSDFMKLVEGENRFRILDDEPRIGWEGWKDGKPFRREGVEKNIDDDEVDTDSKFGTAKPKINHFWAFRVFDYADKSVKILEITQKTVMKAIEGLAADSDWGNPVDYDLNITRTEANSKTTYAVKSYPHKPITKDIEKALAASEIDLDDFFQDAFDSHRSGKK